MDENQEFAALNPAIKEATIGIRKLRKIKIYPLSMADQIEFTGLVISSVVTIFETVKGGVENIAFAHHLYTLIKENIGKLLVYITDEGEALLKELSNEQALAIAEIVYEVNYGIMEKKAVPFVERLRKAFLPEQSLPQSSAGSPNTDTRTSSGDLFERED